MRNVIHVRHATWRRLQDRATPFRGSERDTPDKVIAHLLDTVDRLDSLHATGGLEALRRECEYDPEGDTGVDSLIGYKDALEDIVADLLPEAGAVTL